MIWTMARTNDQLYKGECVCDQQTHSPTMGAWFRKEQRLMVLFLFFSFLFFFFPLLSSLAVFGVVQEQARSWALMNWSHCWQSVLELWLQNL